MKEEKMCFEKKNECEVSWKKKKLKKKDKIN